MSSVMTLSQVARLFGLSEKTILFYELEGLLVPLRVGSANTYGPKERRRIELILKGGELGFSLEELKTILSPRTSVDPGQTS